MVRPRSWDLYCHVAAQLQVARPIHLAHATDPDGRNDLVWSEPRSRGEWHALSLFQLLVPVEGGRQASRLTTIGFGRLTVND
jgi:hypothetical protein